MERSLKHSPRGWQTDKEIDRVNARLRHFRGVAAGVMNDALEILREVWDSCQDPRSWQDIVDGVPEPVARTPAGGWVEFQEKLHLLGLYLDYAKRLCEGSLTKGNQSEREEKIWPKNSESSEETMSPRPARFSLPKKG
jgi:hypothetical protein